MQVLRKMVVYSDVSDSECDKDKNVIYKSFHDLYSLLELILETLTETFYYMVLKLNNFINFKTALLLN